MNNDQLFAFVLMPFDSSFSDIYQLGIKETALSFNIIAERVDDQIYQEGILDRIYRQIDSADLIIADMTGQNANVFYEVGYAHAKQKLCILLTQDSNDIPFDLKHHRHIVYGNSGKSITTLNNLLTKELEWVKKEIEKIRSSHINVNMKGSFGYLETTTWSAQGKINFVFDLLNNSSKASADIDAIYFYSGKGWKLKQGEIDCPSTESDLSEYSIRHFLTSPVRKLQKNTWAQVKFTSSKYLAFKTDGDELKDTYKVTGKALLRLATSDGNFDYEFNIDVECDEIPF